MIYPNACHLCPVNCGANRNIQKGACHIGNEIPIPRSALHPWEEPCISGKNGSGTIFFSGCNLSCIFCQNQAISRNSVGDYFSVEQLAEEILRLQNELHAENINFVTGTHMILPILEALKICKKQLYIPVVWNSSGYETVESLRLLEPFVDIYLPDFKFLSPETAKQYSKRENYPEVAKTAIAEMLRQKPKVVFKEDLLKSGVMIRHLVLPGHRKESMALLDYIGTTFQDYDFLISIMGQYTPPTEPLPFSNLNRKLTTMEYHSVLNHCEIYQLNGYSQDRTSSSDKYIPDFKI